MRSPLGVAGLAVLVAMLALGLWQAVGFRLETGDIYPDWSSLRTGPGGVKIVHDSLTGTGQFDVQRSFLPLRQAPRREAAILLLGFAPAVLIDAEETELDEFEQAASRGNRVVIALDAAPGLPRYRRFPGEKSPLAEKWGIRLGAPPENGDEPPMYFERASGWTTDKSAGGKAITIERTFGHGSIVLSAEGDAVLNRNVARERDASMLIEWIGPYSRVVFDESHLGVSDSGSVLGLVHRYRLNGVLWGLLLVAAVFIWRNAAGFPPPENRESLAVAGADARSGLVQLLRRRIPVQRIMETCVAEWRRSNPRRALAAIEGQRDPLEAYRSIQQELTRK